ncbi:MAG TPA: glycosyltransferase family 4 protein [Chthoniobacterales bacterium]|nr:glycosyltransferase family 4 protein [Chthoniobacterales bacterium]
MRLLCIVDHGDPPSLRLRLKDCLPYYSNAGIVATIISVRRSSLRDRFRILQEAGRHDAVILFRTTGFGPLELKLLRRANPRIIFDFDDALMFREQKFARPLRVEEFEKFARTMRHCAAAVAGNDFLGSFAEACGVKTIVLPTPIDLTKYRLKESSNEIGGTVGWLGLSDGLPYVRQIQPALRRLSDRFANFKLKIISDKSLKLDGVRIDNELWRAETEQENLASFDVGIMPLSDSVWARGKCGYKILQYMGVGTAVVASDVGFNNQIITSGENGFLARSEDEWVRSIATLFEQPDLRRSMGRRGRDLVEQKYSLDHFAKVYIDLLREVAQPHNSA